MKDDQFVYLHARENKRYRYNLSNMTFETCIPLDKTIYTGILTSAWDNWRECEDIDTIEALKSELIAKIGL
jgi:hypothetical protein